MLRSDIRDKLPRFIRQTNKYNCAATAIINYWKFCGLNVTKADLKILSRFLRTNEEGKNGTLSNRIEGILNAEFKKCKWSILKKHLIKIGPALILQPDHIWLAYCVIKNQETGEERVLAINLYSAAETYTDLEFEEMKRRLRYSKVILCGETFDVK